MHDIAVSEKPDHQGGEHQAHPTQPPAVLEEAPVGVMQSRLVRDTRSARISLLSWHLSVVGIYQAGNEHVVLKVDVRSKKNGQASEFKQL